MDGGFGRGTGQSQQTSVEAGGIEGGNIGDGSNGVGVWKGKRLVLDFERSEDNGGVLGWNGLRIEHGDLRKRRRCRERFE